ncbi:MAG: hypothetical protein ABW087_02695 [Candidatus Thiodiazotropha sp.]
MRLHRICGVRFRSHLRSYARAYAYRGLTAFASLSMAVSVGAVRRGEGELKYRWQLPTSPWRVELTWTRKLGISLAYLVNALDRQQREADESSL